VELSLSSMEIPNYPYFIPVVVPIFPAVIKAV